MTQVNLGNVRGATGATGATGAKGDTGATGAAGASTFAGLTDKTTADIPATNTPTATAIAARELGSNKKTNVDANKTSDTFFPSVKAVFDWVSGLFVKGAVSSTDNAVARFGGTTGKLLQNSDMFISDSGSVGIGTASPATKVHILGASETPAGAYYGVLKIDTNSGTNDVGFKLGALAGVGSAGYGFIQATHTGVSNDANLILNPNGGYIGISITSPTATLDVNGTSRFRSSATFNGQIIDNVGSSGVDGQVLKKVGGLVLWSNP